MAKRIKKPAVEPKVRRAWFRRHEEEGEPLAHIAKADGYDIRTVKKLIDLERQERESKEARAVVLRKALEDHYNDLCVFAQKLDSQIISERDTLSTLRHDRMWAALREHLPRSLMWRNFDRRENIEQEIIQSRHEMETSLEREIQSRTKLKFTTSPQEVGISRRVVEALSARITEMALGQADILTDEDFEKTPDGEGIVILELHRFRIGKFPEQQALEIVRHLCEIVEGIASREEFSHLRRLSAELGQVQRILRDELAIIILRRVVPGRCRYCPI